VRTAIVKTACRRRDVSAIFLIAGSLGEGFEIAGTFVFVKKIAISPSPIVPGSNG
jgi:hypothetical protein